MSRTLHPQPKTSNQVPELLACRRGELDLPDQPRSGAAVHRTRPGSAATGLAASLGITERSAYGIVTDLAEAGYIVKQKNGRRNRYQIQAHLAAARTHQPGTRRRRSPALLAGPAPGRDQQLAVGAGVHGGRCAGGELPGVGPAWHGVGALAGQDPASAPWLGPL